MIVIVEGTRKLLGNLFELQELGAKEIKGIAGSVPVWAALRASSVESRFEALHASGLTTLVGREEEYELLLRRWTRAKRTAKARWCSSPGRRESVNRGSPQRCWKVSPPSRTPACAISVLRSTPTARSIPLSARWNVPPDWRTSDRPASDALGMSASLRSRPNLRTAANRRGGRVGPGNFTPSLSQNRT
jgi:hypothetical protein